MKKFVLIILVLFSFGSCKSSKKVKNNKVSTSKVITKTTKTNNSIKHENSNNKVAVSKADGIVKFAKQFKGVKYKWGGTTKAGMDCSGLVFESFRSHDIYLPRISRDMAKKGKKLNLKDVKKGDLLFFKTKNRRNAINHVGLIVEIKNNDIKFIHATTSKGVIVSGLNENYWLKAFVEARRIL